jgi:TetR/AcrR family transcriptional regulator, transcriptional repressor for nem operon
VIAIETRHESKTKLLDAALHVIRAKGYSATRIEDVCEEAGLTKGSFFHHFSSKEDLALAAADYWGYCTSAMFAAAAYHDLSKLPDPLDRLLAYIDLRKALIKGDLPAFTCLVGTIGPRDIRHASCDPRSVQPGHQQSCCHTGSGH